MAVKRNEERGPLIKKLVTQYGLSSLEIARAIGISEHTIAADRHRERMPNIKLSRKQKFQKLLADYSLCMSLSPSGPDAEFCKVLERVLNVSEIMLKLKGMEETAKALCVNRFASEDKSFYDLLIFVSQKSLFQIPNPQEFWREYLHNVHASVIEGGNTSLLPDSHDALIAELARGYTDTFRGAVKLKWTSEIGLMVREGVLETLRRLTEKESTIVKMRFGIEYDRKYTLVEIGKSFFGVGSERVRQIGAQALRKLRHPSMLLKRISLIHVLLSGNEELFFHYQQGRKEIARLEDMLAYEKTFTISTTLSVGPSEFLATPISDIEMSVRTYNGLKNAHCKYFGDVAQKTEHELLRTRNFGRKSLLEIKEILKNRGIDLGMRLDATSLALYKKMTDKA